MKIWTKDAPNYMGARRKILLRQTICRGNLGADIR
jgi:hypothetical protein